MRLQLIAATCGALAFSGCTQTHLEARPDGTFALDYSRAATAAAVTVTLPDGSRLDYSSDPQTAGFDRLAGLLERVLALIAAGGGVVSNQTAAPAAAMPVPLQTPPVPLTMGGGLWQRF